MFGDKVKRVALENFVGTLSVFFWLFFALIVYFWTKSIDKFVILMIVGISNFIFVYFAIYKRYLCQKCGTRMVRRPLRRFFKEVSITNSFKYRCPKCKNIYDTNISPYDKSKSDADYLHKREGK